MTSRERRRHALLQRLQEVLGEQEAATLMEHLPPDRWNELATRRDLERFATKDDLERFATKDDLERFATKDDLERFATKDDLERFATKDDLDREVSNLGLVLTERITGQGYRLEALLRERIDAQTRLLVFAIIGAVLTAASVAIGAVAV